VRFYAFFGILMHTGDALFLAESDVSQRCGPRRSPRSVAVEEVRSKVGLPPVTDIACHATGRAVTVGSKAPLPGLASQVPGGAVPAVPPCPRLRPAAL
jgi:hypothetical protein